MDEKWHGTSGGYSNHRCKCDPCRVAWNAYIVTYRKRRVSVRPESIPHGSSSGYNLGCRCAPCTKAHRDYSSAKRHAYRGATRPKGSSCELCGVLTTRLALDHDHETGLFRGWLCTACNTGLGKMGDTIEGLERAIAYLKRHPGKL